MKRRFLCILLALCMALPAMAGTAAAADGPVTRAAFVRALAAASGDDLTAYAGAASSFADVNAKSPYGPAIAWAYHKWLINGGAGGKFRPDDSITRQEAAAILGRYLDYRYTELPAGCGTGSPDNYNIAQWAQNGVFKCWMYGIIDMSGEANRSFPDGTSSSALEFRPHDTVTMAEALEWSVNVNQVTASAIAAPEEKSFADSLAAAVDAQGNWLLSPYSIRMCLAMAANGAKGTTREELLRALQIDDLDGFNQNVRQRLETYDGFARIMSLETANSLWLNQSQLGGSGAFRPSFEASMANNYRASVKEVTNRDSVERVNAWVNSQTNGKIPTILTEDNREFAAALINAVYFKAAWASKFAPALTKKGSFANLDGTVAQADFMHQTGNLGYYSTPGIEALKLDYQNYAADNEMGDHFAWFRDADFSMYFILADKGLDVQNFLDQAVFSTSKVAVSVPKFKLEYGGSLDSALKALGVTAAYDEDLADLSAMMDPSRPGGKLYLDTVLQKAYIAIDEEGTEAAAVTAAMGGNTSMPVRQPLVRDFTADRPFYFAIRDNASGELLFLGRYTAVP